MAFVIRLACTFFHFFPTTLPAREPMAKPNYQFDKRQRDIAKKKKQDEKRARKQTKDEPESTGTAAADSEAAPASGAASA